MNVSIIYIHITAASLNAEVVVELQDINDNPPTFEIPQYPETIPAGTPIYLMAVPANAQPFTFVSQVKVRSKAVK